MMLKDPSATPSLGSLLSEQLSSLSRSLAVSRASRHVSLRRFLEIEGVYPWMRLWDWALCYGVKGTKVCQKLLRLVARPVFGDRLCLQCSGEIDLAVPFFDHFLSQCSNQSMPNMDHR